MKMILENDTVIGWLTFLTRMLDVKGGRLVQKMFLPKELIDAIKDGVRELYVETYSWEHENPPPIDDDITIIRLNEYRIEIREYKYI